MNTSQLIIQKTFCLLTASIFSLGLVAQGIQALEFEQIKRDGNMIYDEYFAETSFGLDPDNAEVFKIEAGAGAMEVTTSTSGRIEVQARIYITAKNEKKLNETIADDLVLSLEKQDGEIKLISKLEATRRTKHGNQTNVNGFMGAPGRSIDLMIAVPEGLFVMIHDGAGDIKITNLEGGLKLNDQSGDIRISGLRGDLTLNDASGDIQISDVNGSGKSVIRDASGDVSVKSMKGDLEIHDAAGELRVENIGGSVQLVDGSGGISVKGVGGSLKVVDASGDINLKNIEGAGASEYTAMISDQSGDIYGENINGNVKVNDGSGEVRMQSVSGQVHKNKN